MEDNSEIKSQDGGFNNKNYVKKWNVYFGEKSTDINISNNWKLGETVIVTETHSEFANEKGKICIGFSKKSEEICIKFKSGKKEFIDKFYLRKISMFDYLEDEK